MYKKESFWNKLDRKYPSALGLIIVLFSIFIGLVLISIIEYYI